MKSVEIVTQQALTDIQILDFTRVLAGSVCTMGDIGAEAIKVDTPGHGSLRRLAKEVA